MARAPSPSPRWEHLAAWPTSTLSLPRLLTRCAWASGSTKPSSTAAFLSSRSELERDGDGGENNNHGKRKVAMIYFRASGNHMTLRWKFSHEPLWCSLRSKPNKETTPHLLKVWWGDTGMEMIFPSEKTDNGAFNKWTWVDPARTSNEEDRKMLDCYVITHTDDCWLEVITIT